MDLKEESDVKAELKQLFEKHQAALQNILETELHDHDFSCAEDLPSLVQIRRFVENSIDLGGLKGVRVIHDLSRPMVKWKIKQINGTQCPTSSCKASLEEFLKRMVACQLKRSAINKTLQQHRQENSERHLQQAKVQLDSFEVTDLKPAQVLALTYQDIQSSIDSKRFMNFETCSPPQEVLVKWYQKRNYRNENGHPVEGWLPFRETIDNFIQKQISCQVTRHVSHRCVDAYINNGANLNRLKKAAAQQSRKQNLEEDFTEEILNTAIERFLASINDDRQQISRPPEFGKLLCHKTEGRLKRVAQDIANRERRNSCTSIQSQSNRNGSELSEAFYDKRAICPQEAAINKAEIEQLKKCLAELPEMQRDSIREKHMEGSKLQQAADTLGIPLGTFTYQVARGLRNLKRCLEKNSVAKDV